jgi:hypothetical protein
MNLGQFVLPDSNISLKYVSSPANPTMTLGGTGVLNGSYQYKCTFYTATGETAANGVDSAPVLSSISPSSQKVIVTIPVSSNPLVIGRRIYRTVANSVFPYVCYLLADINNNTATTYEDNIADVALGVPLAPYQNTTGGQVKLPGGNGNLGPGSFALGTNVGISKGFGNMFLGENAGNPITTGVGNTITGMHAGASITTGFGNTFVGYRAGNAVVSGQDNTIFGDDAGLVLTGSWNTIIGQNAGRALVSGVENAFLGVNCGMVSTGSYNVYFGCKSAFGNTTGQQNVFMGAYAGYGNVSGSNSVFLGYCAGFYETGTSKFFIDSLDRGNEADSRTKSLMYGVFNASVASQSLTFNAGLMGFFGHVAAAQPAAITGADTAAQLADLIGKLIAIGLIAA